MTGQHQQQQAAREMFHSLVEATRTINRSARENKLEELESAMALREKILQDAAAVASHLAKSERHEILGLVQDIDRDTQDCIERSKTQILHDLETLNKRKAVLKYSR